MPRIAKYRYTPEESKIVERMASKKRVHAHTNKPLSSNVMYLTVGNFTTCLIEHKDGFRQLGIAKRNPTDQYNEDIGKSLAFARAIQTKGFKL